MPNIQIKINKSFVHGHFKVNPDGGTSFVSPYVNKKFQTNDPNGLVRKNPPTSAVSPEEDYNINDIYSEAFKQWFGDWINDPYHSSKVTKTGGYPQVVYPLHFAPDPDGNMMEVYPARFYKRLDPQFVSKNALGFYLTPERHNQNQNPDTDLHTVHEDYRPAMVSHYQAMYPEKASQPSFGELKRLFGQMGDLRILHPQGINDPEFLNMLHAHAAERTENHLPCYAKIIHPFDLEENVDNDIMRKLFRFLPPLGDAAFLACHRRGGEKSSHNWNQSVLGIDIYTGMKMLKRLDQLSEMLQALEYDGVTYQTPDEEKRIWIAFQPNQVKAEKNEGTFDNSSSLFKSRR